MKTSTRCKGDPIAVVPDVVCTTIVKAPGVSGITVFLPTDFSCTIPNPQPLAVIVTKSNLIPTSYNIQVGQLDTTGLAFNQSVGATLTIVKNVAHITNISTGITVLQPGGTTVTGICNSEDGSVVSIGLGQISAFDAAGIVYDQGD